MDEVSVQNEVYDQSDKAFAAQMSHFFGIIRRKYFILTHLYCKTSFALHITFYVSICIV